MRTQMALVSSKQRADEALKHCQFFHIYATLFTSLQLLPHGPKMTKEQWEKALTFTNGWRLFMLNETLQCASVKTSIDDALEALEELLSRETESIQSEPGNALRDQATHVMKRCGVRYGSPLNYRCGLIS